MKHFSKRAQETCIDFIDLESIGHPERSLESILQDTFARYRIPTRTLRRWYNHFINWGEYPYETKSKLEKFNKRGRKFKRTKVVTEAVYSTM